MKKLGLTAAVLLGIVLVGAFVYEMFTFASYVQQTVEQGLKNLPFYL